MTGWEITFLVVGLYLAGALTALCTWSYWAAKTHGPELTEDQTAALVFGTIFWPLVLIGLSVYHAIMGIHDVFHNWGLRQRKLMVSRGEITEKPTKIQKLPSDIW